MCNISTAYNSFEISVFLLSLYSTLTSYPQYMLLDLLNSALSLLCQLQPKRKLKKKSKTNQLQFQRIKAGYLRIIENLEIKPFRILQQSLNGTKQASDNVYHIFST